MRTYRRRKVSMKTEAGIGVLCPQAKEPWQLPELEEEREEPPP